MSTKSTIITSIINSLKTIKGVNLVTKDLDKYRANDKDYHAILLQDKITEVDEIAYDHPTSEDREGTLELTIEALIVVRNRNKVEEELHRVDSAIEEKMQNSLSDCMLDLETIDTDYSIEDKMAFIQQVWNIKYLYNHNNP